MNKRNLLKGAGALVLLTAGVFAGRASARLNTAPALYYTTNGTTASCTTLLSSTAPVEFTTQPSAGTTQAAIITSNNTTPRKVFYTSACGSTHKVYFR